jgi:hypothetical protein
MFNPEEWEVPHRGFATEVVRKSDYLQLKSKIKEFAAFVISVEGHCTNESSFPKGCGECLYCHAVGFSGGEKP